MWGCGGTGDRRLSYSITWFCSWSPCANCSYRLSQFLNRTPNLRLRIFVSRLYFCDMEDSQEREGLRMLKKAGVQITVMSYKGERINRCICGRDIKSEQMFICISRARYFWKVKSAKWHLKSHCFPYRNHALGFNNNDYFFPLSLDYFYCWQTFVARRQSNFKAWEELNQNSVRLARKLNRILQVDSPYCMFSFSQKGFNQTNNDLFKIIIICSLSLFLSPLTQKI